MQPRFTAHTTWARSVRTRASLSVPLGVDTTAVSSQSGCESGTRFWKKDLPFTPLGKRCISAGRPPTAASSGPSTAS